MVRHTLMALVVMMALTGCSTVGGWFRSDPVRIAEQCQAPPDVTRPQIVIGVVINEVLEDGQIDEDEDSDIAQACVADIHRITDYAKELETLLDGYR